jgi:hypothetical protein
MSAQSPPFTGDFRRTSQIEYLDELPWASVTLLYVGFDGDVLWVAGTQIVAKRELVRRAREHDGRLFIVWPGRYAADVFLVDDLDALGDR